ncbi:unnamed protein product, partial [Symbiodinium microadriaticum]
EACPHLYALGNRAGLEALVHAAQGARNSGPSLLLPRAATRHLRQAEGVEPGDPLCPALFCLGLQPALADLQREFREDLGERILAYFDDATERVLHFVRRFEHHLARHTRLRLVGKTAIWNGAGLAPGGWGELSSATRVWFGDPALEPSSRGILLLGTPFGEPQFLAKLCPTGRRPSSSRCADYRELGDTQVSWLLLLYTAAPRAQFAWRTLPRRLARDFAHAFDTGVLTALSVLLLAEGPSPIRRQLPVLHNLFFVMWAWVACRPPCIRDAPFVNSLVQTLDDWSPVQDLAHASDALAEAGIALPRWVDLPRHGPARATDDADPDDPDVPYRGWQCSAFRVLDDRGSAEHRRAVGPAELAFLDSQFGNLALSPQGGSFGDPATTDFKTEDNQAIGDHFDAALIMSVCPEARSRTRTWGGDSGTSFTADPSSCTFERSTPCPEGRQRRGHPEHHADAHSGIVQEHMAEGAAAAARSLAASLLSLPISNTANLDGEAPLLSDVLNDSSETPPLTSRMG